MGLAGTGLARGRSRWSGTSRLCRLAKASQRNLLREQRQRVVDRQRDLLACKRVTQRRIELALAHPGLSDSPFQSCFDRLGFPARTTQCVDYLLDSLLGLAVENRGLRMGPEIIQVVNRL